MEALPLNESQKATLSDFISPFVKRPLLREFAEGMERLLQFLVVDGCWSALGCLLHSCGLASLAMPELKLETTLVPDTLHLMQEDETCYVCPKPSTSREHVPPKSLFPPQFDSTHLKLAAAAWNLRKWMPGSPFFFAPCSLQFGRSVAIVLPPARPNLRNAFDLSPSAAEPHMNVLAFHSERRCEILDGNTLVTCLFERCQD